MRLRSALGTVLMAAVLLVSGCESNNKGKIEGTRWSSKALTYRGMSVPAGALQLEFRKDGKMVYRVGFQTYTGTYSLGLVNQVSFHLDQALIGRKDHQETVVISGKQMTVTDPDGTEAVFVRVP